MAAKGSILLFWWSEIHLQHRDKENYGDLLGKYLVEKISERPAKWVHPKKFSIQQLWKPTYVTIGSILAQVTSKCVVWGSGIIDRKHPVAAAKFVAVRGPKTRERLLELGYTVPAVYGDPALLLPLFFKPEIKKQHQLGVIPHYNDYEHVKKVFQDHSNVKVIDLMTNDIEGTTEEIMACEQIISSSLHGVILGHTYGIPAVQVEFSKKIYGDGVKYQDYFQSVKLEGYEPLWISEEINIDALISYVKDHEQCLPKSVDVKNLQDGLLASCPFR